RASPACLRAKQVRLAGNAETRRDMKVSMPAPRTRAAAARLRRGPVPVASGPEGDLLVRTSSIVVPVEGGSPAVLAATATGGGEWLQSRVAVIVSPSGSASIEIDRSAKSSAGGSGS